VAGKVGNRKKSRAFKIDGKFKKAFRVDGPAKVWIPLPLVPVLHWTAVNVVLLLLALDMMV